MAGGTKCYRVTKLADGTLHREVVSYSPKYADPLAKAVEKLTSTPPTAAIVRFHEIQEVVSQVTAATVKGMPSGADDFWANYSPKATGEEPTDS